MKFFLPRQQIFFELLKKLCQHLKEMSVLFTELTNAPSLDHMEPFTQKAKEIENDADDVAHEIIDELNKTFITPIDREDIYTLAHEVDDIVDLIENVINNIKLYKIKEKRRALNEFAGLISRAADATIDLFDALPNLKNTSKFKNLGVKIHELEDQGDVVFQNAIYELFNEDDVKKIVRWKDILENLERILDRYQRVSDTIQSIVVKSL